MRYGYSKYFVLRVLGPFVKFIGLSYEYGIVYFKAINPGILRDKTSEIDDKLVYIPNDYECNNL